MPTGYCTVEDIRRALRDADLPGDASQDRDIVIDAITGQTEWLNETTHRHWYEPAGISEDTDGLIPTATKTHTNEAIDIPSSPHAQHDQLIRAGQSRRPIQTSGPYTQVKLTRRDVTQLSALEVRQRDGGFTDWVADSDYTSGPGNDYYLQVDDSGGFTDLFIDTRSLPRLDHYGDALRVTYDWGIEGLPRTVRRAVALRAAAQLLLDDAAALGIPENASFVAAESKVQAMERQAEELLEVHQ